MCRESLASRREGAVIALGLKLLDGGGRGSLQKHTPMLNLDTDASAQVGLAAGGVVKRRLDTGVQVVPFPRDKKYEMLGSYERSYFGLLPKVWSKVPQDIIKLGLDKGWRRIKKRCKNALVSEKKTQSNIATVA